MFIFEVKNSGDKNKEKSWNKDLRLLVFSKQNIRFSNGKIYSLLLSKGFGYACIYYFNHMQLYNLINFHVNGKLTVRYLRKQQVMFR